MSYGRRTIGNDMAVILMGPPGAGKATQSELLAKRFDLVHIITSELIKNALYRPENQDDPVIIREKKIFENGGINTPEWVTKMTLAKTEEAAQSKKGVIFSSSPRTLYEAQVLMPLLKQLYPPKNIFIFLLYLKLKKAKERIKERRVCSDCRVPVSPQEKLSSCLRCGGDIIARFLDDEDKLKVRFDQYREKTEPVMDFFGSERFPHRYIDGNSSMDHVSAKLLFEICSAYQG